MHRQQGMRGIREMLKQDVYNLNEQLETRDQSIRQLEGSHQLELKRKDMIINNFQEQLQAKDQVILWRDRLIGNLEVQNQVWSMEVNEKNSQIVELEKTKSELLKQLEEQQEGNGTRKKPRMEAEVNAESN